MYFCPRGEATWSQRPQKGSDFEAKRITTSKATHFLVWLGKFALHVGELTSSRFAFPEPRSLKPRRSGHTVHRTLTAPPTFLGGARHVLPAVWIPLFLRSPGNRPAAWSDNGRGREKSHHWLPFPRLQGSCLVAPYTSQTWLGGTQGC